MATGQDTNVERLRELYGQWAQGDFTSLEIFDPNIETTWDSNLLDTSVDRGLEAFVTTFRQIFEAFEDVRFVAARPIPAENQVVVVLGEWHGVGRRTRLPLSAPVAHVWTFSGDKAIRMAGFLGHEQGLEAARVDPGDLPPD